MSSLSVSHSQAPLRIGIAGLGTVGGEVSRLLQSEAGRLSVAAGRRLQIVAVSARDASKSRGIDMQGVRFYADAADMAADENIDMIVELIGGAEGVAKDLVLGALRAEKAVITANKALLSTHARDIAAAMATGAGTLSFEAAVAGAIPVIKTMREALASNRIHAVTGILNGTCNYILSTMEQTGRAFADVLAEAQRLGYAEADPSFDIDGIDAAHKLSILAGIAFGFAPDKNTVTAKGIAAIAADDFKIIQSMGARFRLLCRAEQPEAGAVLATVAPTVVLPSSSFYSVTGPQNAVRIDGSHTGEIFLKGAGAGGAATASAVVADIIDAARGNILPFAAGGVPAVAQARQGGIFYARFADKPAATAWCAGASAVIATSACGMAAIAETATVPVGAVSFYPVDK